MDFLARSSIYYALTVSPIVSTSFVEQFWMTAKSRTVNNISYIDATVAGKPVTISEASIRSDLLFDDTDGIDSLNYQAIFDNIQLMGEDQPQTQTNPSPRLSPSIAIPDSNPEGSGGNHGGQSSNDISLSGNEDGLTLQSVYDLCVSLCKQKINNIKTEDAQDERRTCSKILELSLSRDTVMLEEKESAEKGVSTAQPKVRIDKPKVSTDKDDEGTAEPKYGNSDESATPTMTSTPTPTVFGDDETIAQVLITMSQNKVKQKEKEKGVEIKDTEDTDRPRTRIERSILTLKPLPKIDPKAKGKKKIEEEDESDTESEDITEAEKKFKMLANNEEIARKVQK
ncbi:hypothetical protein Tco_0528983 [Tanacetum coccineum]